MTDVRPEEPVEFSWQTVGAGVLLLSKFLSAFVHSSSFTKPSQELFSSSLRAVTFSEIKKGEFLNFSGLILVERYNDS